MSWTNKCKIRAARILPNQFGPCSVAKLSLSTANTGSSTFPPTPVTGSVSIGLFRSSPSEVANAGDTRHLRPRIDQEGARLGNSLVLDRGRHERDRGPSRGGSVWGRAGGHAVARIELHRVSVATV